MLLKLIKFSSPSSFIGFLKCHGEQAPSVLHLP